MQKYTNKVDIWALGCIVYEVIFRKKAFPDDYAIYAMLEYGQGLMGPLLLPSELEPFLDKGRIETVSKIILSMLNIDPNKRPGADELHEWFISWGACELPPPPSPSESSVSVENYSRAAELNEGKIVPLK